MAESGGSVTPGITEPFAAVIDAAVIDGAVAADEPLPVAVVGEIAGVEVGATVLAVARFAVSGIGAAAGAGSSIEPTVAEADDPSAVLGVATIEVAIGGAVGAGAWSLLEEHELAKLPASTPTRSDRTMWRRTEFMRVAEPSDKHTFRSTRTHAQKSAIESNSRRSPNALRKFKPGRVSSSRRRGKYIKQVHDCASA